MLTCAFSSERKNGALDASEWHTIAFERRLLKIANADSCCGIKSTMPSKPVAIAKVLPKLAESSSRRLLDLIERIEMEQGGKFPPPGLHLPPRSGVRPLIRRKMRNLPPRTRAEVLDYARYLKKCQGVVVENGAGKAKQRLSWWAPTPRSIVIEALKLAEIGPYDLLFDLGCGDGRVIADAAGLFGARAIGFDIDPLKVREARVRIRRAGISQKVQVRRQSILAIPDLYRPTVIYLYLTQRALKRVLPILARRCRKGTRIITVDTWNHRWPPEKTLSVQHGRYRWRIGLWIV